MNEPTAKLVVERRFREMQLVDNKRFDPAELRLSETGFPCQRLRALRCMGFEMTEHQDDLLGLFEAGHVWEAWYAALLQSQYPLLDVVTQAEVLTPPEFRASGHMDIMVPMPPEDMGDRTRFYEVKNIRQAALAYGLPKEMNLWQVQAYHHFGRRYGLEVPGVGRFALPHDTVGELVYITRESLKVEAFVVEYQPEMGEELEAKTGELRESISDGRIPPVEHTPDEFPCYYKTKDYEVYCPAFKHCHHEEVSAEPVLTLAELGNTFHEYRGVKEALAGAEAKVADIKTRKAIIENIIAGTYNTLGTHVAQAADIQIKRSIIADRVYHDPVKAYTMGIITKEQLDLIAQVSKVGGGHTRWYFKELGGK